MTHDTDTTWPAPDRIAAPAADDVHVYRTLVPPTLAPGLADALALDERERAGRLKLPRAHRSFVTARAMLRHILGACLNLPPAAVPIRYAPQGKPLLVDSPFAFNLSHAGDIVLVALTRACPVGIDVECLQPERSWAPVAERFFTPGERAALAAAPETDRWRTFLTIWTRKEALVKLTGEGMWSAFKQADADAHDTHRAQTVLDLAPAPQYLAALALGGPAGPLRPFTWSPRDFASS